ncbi:MAG TPA: RNA polymerase sigma factor [Candidatus Dormibacteraeota bacterium]|nr:RNA polymerase sigma factor [Candidatus Dormibacteraeota bacterium]
MEGRPLDDRELATRASNGDVEAYESLVSAYSDIAFRTAYLITGSAADAEDAVQDALVKAYRALTRFRTGEPFRPWLLRIVANEARNRRRSAGRWWRRTETLAPELQLRDPARSPEETAEAAEERATLLRSLNRMKPDDRAVITCRYLLELSTEETGAALGWPTGTVKSRLSRALDRLRGEVVGSAVGEMA